MEIIIYSLTLEIKAIKKVPFFLLLMKLLDKVLIDVTRRDLALI